MALEDIPYRRRLFIEFYLGESNGNATDAARKAGYAHPAVAGSRLLRKANVRAKINERVAELSLGPAAVIGLLTDHAQADIGDFIKINHDGNGYTIDLQKAKKQGKLHLIKKIRTTEEGTYIELHDAHSALLKLGNHYGLFANDLGPVPSATIKRAVETKGAGGTRGPDDRGE